MTHIPKSAASPKAGGDFAEEIVGHWQLYYKTTQHVSLEAIGDQKAQIRKRCVPKSDKSELRKRIEAKMNGYDIHVNPTDPNDISLLNLGGKSAFRWVLSILEAEEK